MTGGDFAVLGAGSPELAQAMGTTPQQALDAQRGAGAGGIGAGRAGGANPGTAPNGRAQGTPLGFGGGRVQLQPNQSGSGGRVSMAGRGPITAAGQAANVQAGGGIIAVTSKSKDTSMRLYNGKNKYNEWIFMALQTSTAAGFGGRGAQAPGGRGGQVPGGRGGGAIPGGRGNTTSPFGRSTTQGRGGFSPMGTGGR
jgi:hypothetical protein